MPLRKRQFYYCEESRSLEGAYAIHRNLPETIEARMDCDIGGQQIRQSRERVYRGNRPARPLSPEKEKKPKLTPGANQDGGHRGSVTGTDG